jgi:hypothetical protein
VGSVQEIVEQIKKTPQAAGRSDAELQSTAESVRSQRTFAANFLFRPFEFVLLTLTCLVAAYFAAVYGLYHDKGEGKPAGSLLQPTLIGTAVGAVVLWGALSTLVLSDGHAAEAAKAKAAKTADAHTHHSDAKHDGHDHKTAERHEVHAAGHNKDWRFDLWNYARLLAYLVGTVTAAFVGVLAPRGPAARRPQPVAPSGLQPAH